MLPPLPPAGFEYFRMPIGFDLLENIRDAIGIEQLYYCLTKHEFPCYFHGKNGVGGGLEPQYWNTPEGREVLASTGIVDVRGEESIVIVMVPHKLIQNIKSQDRFLEDKDEISPDAAIDEIKPISDADIRKATDVLRSKTLTENLTRPQQEEFLRQSFPRNHFTSRQIASIFKEIKVKRGRPKKSDNQL